MSTSFFVNNGGSTAARDTIEGQVAAATTAKEDAVKVTNTAYNAQYTLSDGTTGYSANHYSQNSASISATVNTNMLETGNFRSEALEHRNRSEGFKDEAQSFRNDAESYKNQAEAATSNLVNLVGNESITGNKTFTGDIIASGGNVVIGTSVNSGAANTGRLKVRHDVDYSSTEFEDNATLLLQNEQNNHSAVIVFHSNNSSGSSKRAGIVGGNINSNATGLGFYGDIANKDSGDKPQVFIDANGNLLTGTTNTNPAENDVTGVAISADGRYLGCSDQNEVMRLNRKGNDGAILVFHQAGTAEGSVSVSGSTVSYNAFSGSHWSRLADNSQPTILKGTLIETIDEMCDWYQAQFTIPATTKVNEDGDTVEDVAAYTVKDPIALPSGASVGDSISRTRDGVTYSATIVKEGDNKHTKCKISDTADSTRIYGVFAAWDSDDDSVNDMYVTAVGTHVVRIHGGQTVSAGDLLVSNGDGTAKVQDDDIIRSKTLGKVLTNIKQETYADNSYTVPCALYCG